MAHRDKSFTVNIIPHDATRSRREWIISGRKLVVFRFLTVLFLLALLASAVVLFTGTAELTKTAELRERNNLLTDSLATARELNRRLDIIELELQEIRDTRTVIENLATAGVSEENTE
ncbi:MAG: hypothetical protein K8S62_08665 [Candidatus Sabulitectum sp.]|nr:hypothetical protein [Candidatus Sabulitectum sp.]